MVDFVAVYRMSGKSNADVTLGTTVYNDDGTKLGTVRGFDEAGFYVQLNPDAEAEEVERLRSGQSYGEMDLMWRCWQCGEMGSLDAMPEECPSCGAGKEELYHWTED